MSGLAWDEASRTLFAISDDLPKIVPLNLSADFQTVTFGEIIPVTVPHAWDGEGIALRPPLPAPEGEGPRFWISNEVGPHVYALDAAGAIESEIPLPSHFQRIRPNLSLESLTLTPDGRYLFTANEQALTGELPGSGQGTLVRILRHDLLTGAQAEFAYRAEPSGLTGRPAVSELAALSSTELLVLERSFLPILGNGVTIYRADLTAAADVIAEEFLTDQAPAVPKTLFLDLAALADDDFPLPLEPQLNRILDNYEGLALGPSLPDGRRVLFLVSDDNKNPTQVARLLVLAAEGL